MARRSYISLQLLIQCQSTLHRNPRRLLSISEIAQADRQQDIEMCTGIAERVVCVSVAIPLTVYKACIDLFS
jgi:hypothetical protein